MHYKYWRRPHYFCHCFLRTGTLAGKGKEGTLQAIYYERGIELAMEGHRFFDLVCWNAVCSSKTQAVDQ